MLRAIGRKRLVRLGCGFFLALGAGLLLAPPAHAQVLYGSLVGTVTDATGANVPAANVTITNADTSQSREGVTDQTGAFTFTDVVSGTYNIKVSKSGFKVLERTGVAVTLNAVTRVQLTLQVGSMTQTVSVTAEAPPLQTDTSEVHADVTSTELANLPVPLGRNYQQIYRAEPGFSPPSNSHSYPTNPSRALSFNVNGTSNNQNNTRIDGVSTYNIQLPHVNSYVPTLDSIQQVNVVTDNFDAEEGFAGGAAINVETKSGTNQFHGDIFEYHNNDHLKAWPMEFDAAGSNIGNKPKYIYNDFGGSYGGPIKKDKLFFFASYEGLFNNFTAQRFSTVPTQDMRLGDLTMSSTDIYDPTTGDPTTGLGRTQFVASSNPADPNFNALCTNGAGCPNMIPQARLDPIAQKILSTQYVPLPDRTMASPSAVRRDYFVSGSRAFHRNQLDTKFNYNASPKLNFIGTFGFLHYNNITPTAFGVAGGGAAYGQGGNPGHGFGNTFRTTIMGTYTFSPNFLMDAHFGWARQGTSSVQNDLGKNIGSDVLGIPGTNGTRNFESGWPEFDISGFDTIGQVDNFMPYYRHDPQKQYVANFNWIKGPHNIRFGTEIYQQALNQTQAESLAGAYGAQGGFNFGEGVTSNCTAVGGTICTNTTDTSRFNGLASLLLGLPDTLGRNYQIPDVYHVHANLFSAYVRDRWNFNPKLTLDYGVRWEYFPMPTRSDRGIEVYDPTTNNMQLCGFASVPAGCGVQLSKRLFGPRVGFAYRATNSFVIRAGYGITFDPYEFMEPLRNNFPVSVATNITNPLGGLFPGGSLATGIPAIATPSLGNGILPMPLDAAYIGYPAKKLKRGYVESWNFTIQKELRWGFTGQVGYVATRQIRELGFYDINSGQVIGAAAAGQPLYNLFGRLTATDNVIPVGTGHYDSLQATLQRRFTKGMMLQVNYTWGKTIDSVDNSDENPGNDDGRLQLLQYMYLNRARAGFDRTQNLEILHVWDLPFGNGQRWGANRRVLSPIVGGWQVSGLASFISGPPFTIYASGTGFNTPGSNQTADQVKSHVARVGSVDPNLPFYDPTAFADVSGARLGTSGFNILNGPGIANYDFSVQRQFRITERYRLLFRMDSFNFANTPHFDIPDNFVPDGIPGPPDFGSFMTVTSTTNLAREGIDERQFEFSLRLNF